MTPVADHPYASTTGGIETLVLVSSGEDMRATFAPSAGMVCCSLRHRGEELLAQRDGVRAYAEQGSTMGIPLLRPWANRLTGFTYGALPRIVELARDCPLIALDNNGLPIHGVIAGHLPWKVREARACSTALGAAGAARGLPLSARARFRGADRRRGADDRNNATRKLGSRGAGVLRLSPYLTIPEASRETLQVELPVMRSLMLDRQMIPTGLSEPIDCPRFELGDSSWDHAFGGLARPPRFAVSAADRRIEFEFLEGFPYAQVFSPSDENFICFEPMTAPTNALVSGIDLPVVVPGEEFRATFRISVADQR